MHERHRCPFVTAEREICPAEQHQFSPGQGGSRLESAGARRILVLLAEICGTKLAGFRGRQPLDLLLEQGPLEARPLHVPRQLEEARLQEPRRHAVGPRQLADQFERRFWRDRPQRKLRRPRQEARVEHPDPRHAIQRRARVASGKIQFGEPKKGLLGARVHLELGAEVSLGRLQIPQPNLRRSGGSMEPWQAGFPLDCGCVVLRRCRPGLAQAQHVGSKPGRPDGVGPAHHEAAGQFAHEAHVVPPETEPRSGLVRVMRESCLKLAHRRGILPRREMAGCKSPPRLQVLGTVFQCPRQKADGLARGAEPEVPETKKKVCGSEIRVPGSDALEFRDGFRELALQEKNQSEVGAGLPEFGLYVQNGPVLGLGRFKLPGTHGRAACREARRDR